MYTSLDKMTAMYGQIFALLALQLHITPGFGTEWKVIVKTADEWLAGTGSTIKIEIFGTDGHMDMQQLGGSFSRDDTATTTFYENFGEPYRIKMYHSGSGLASRWKLSKITIKNGYTGQEYAFPCNCWLDGETKSINGITQVCRDIPNCLSGYKQCRTSISDSRCNKCNDPYYSGGWRGGCKQCPSIDKCTDRHCSRQDNTQCRRCEDNKVFFKLSSDSQHCERLCAWNNHYCWPGTCGSDGLVKNCHCSNGFYMISQPSETSCQLSALPSFETCATQAIGPNGEKKISQTEGPTNECQYQTEYYGNYEPAIIQYDLLALYEIDASHFPSSPYIDSSNFGVTDVSLQIILKDVTGHGLQISGTDPLIDTSLSKKVHMTFSDKGNITVPQRQLKNGDSLCLKYIAKGGGHLISVDTSKPDRPRSQPEPYRKTTSTKTVCYRYDDTEPLHCQENSRCSSEPIELETRISRTPNIKVQWQGWTDPVPAGGQPHHASAIESYQITVNEVSGQKDALNVSRGVVYTKKVNASVTELAINITSQKPKLFCVTLEVKDVADNVKQARRFFLYDNSTNISTRKDKKFYVESASADTNYTWQTHHNDICLNWYDHFYNKFYLDNPLLSRILPDQFGLISGIYEQNTGILPVSGTTNVHGIIRFMFSVALDNIPFSTETEVPDFQKQHFCTILHPNDGDTYRLNIRAVDIANNTFSEEKTLYIDRSVPHIENIELVKDGYRKLFIHDQIDLSKMNLQFDAFDLHSGIRTVEWSFGIADYSNSLDSGAIGVNRGNCSVVKDCYCPKIGKACEVMKYSIPLNGLVHKFNHIGNHNRNYYFTIKVTNNANLFNIEHMDVLVDDSPPEPGVIEEGPVDYPDIDYTSDQTFLVHWHGFIDHESGIKLYRIGLASRCLSKEELYYQNSSLSDILLDEVEFPLNSLRMSANFTGKRYVSCIALNNAMDPSNVVCSDGISKDHSPPSLKNITIADARWSESLYCSRNETWLLRSDLVKIKLFSTQICNSACNVQMNDPLLEGIPSHFSKRNEAVQFNNETLRLNFSEEPENAYADKSDFLCTMYRTYDSNIIYIPNDRIIIHWDVEEDESQMHDYFVGFGKTHKERDAPGLINYISTDRKNVFKFRHSGIGTDREFFVFLKAINKAGLETIVTIGPLLIDQTPPKFKSVPVAEIKGDIIVVGWENNTFYDEEQTEPVSQIFFQVLLGYNGKPASSLMEWRQDSSEACPEYTGGCFKYSLRKLQRQETDLGLKFYFQMHIHNNAGHFIVLKTREFSLPSMYPPGHAVIIDIDPADSAESSRIGEAVVDIDAHFSNNVVCALWYGFEHHEELKIEFGVGSSKGIDDIYRFSGINNTNKHCIMSSKIPIEMEMFVSLRATGTGGSTISSSDGLVIYDKDSVLSRLQVYDGPRCKTSTHLVLNDSLVFSPPLHVGRLYTLQILGQNISDLNFDIRNMTVYVKHIRTSVNSVDFIFQPYVDVDQLFLHSNASKPWAAAKAELYDCEDDISTVVVGQPLNAHWYGLSGQFTYKAATVALLCSNTSNDLCLEYEIPFNNFGEETATFHESSLQPYKKYKVAIKPCLNSKCIGPKFTSGAYSESNSLILKIIESKMLQSNVNCTNIAIQWKIIINTNISFYQWSISMKVGRAKTASVLDYWRTTINNDSNKTYMKIEECVPLHVHAYKHMFGCVRAFTHSGQKVQACKELQFASVYNEFKSIVYDVDASLPSWKTIQKSIHSLYLGDTLKELHDNELDFGTKDADVAGVILYANERNITWCLSTVRDMPEKWENNPDCNSVQTTITGVVKFPKELINFGTIYYICAYSDMSYIVRETFTETLLPIRTCSNGFVLDNDPPYGGELHVDNMNGFIYDPKNLMISWHGFDDDINVTALSYEHKINSYTLEIGSSPSGKDIKQYVNIRDTAFIIVDNMTIPSGTALFVSIVAADHVGLTKRISSEEFVVDITPPDAGRLVSDTLLMSKWINDSLFTIQILDFYDKESGIDYFGIYIGSSRHEMDIMSEATQKNDKVEINLQTLPVADGHIYYVGVKAVSGAGLSSAYVVLEFGVDRTPPVGGHVVDGLLLNGIDVDFQTVTNLTGGHWQGFTDVHSGIEYYTVGLGTSPFTYDIEPVINVGLSTDILWHSTFTPGEKYFITVQACNGADLCRSVSSDGIVLDDSPPIAGLVRVGSSSYHQKYIPSNSFVEIFWTGFEDPQSGMDHFEACIGTIPGDCDVAPQFSCLLSSSHIKTGLSMPVNMNLFVTVTGYNKNNVGVSTSSKPFIADISAPRNIIKPTFITNFTSYSSELAQWEKSILRIIWKFSDSESPIVRHIVTLVTHHEGHTPIESMELGQESKLTINLDSKGWLQSGDTYKALVTACNAAGLCSTAESADLLIDSTPPHLGGFKPPLTWRTSVDQTKQEMCNVNLTWYGFHDQESRIKAFYVGLGRTYTDTGLSNGLVEIKTTIHAKEYNASIMLNGSLRSDDKVVASIYAENNAGLKTPISRVTLIALASSPANPQGIASGILEIEKHSCDIHFCNKDCTCAVVGKVCSEVVTNASCNPAPASPVNSLNVSVYVFGGMSNEPQLMTASSACMAGHWLVAKGSSKIKRFEWTLGIANEKYGEGIFDLITERPWMDVGRLQNGIHCLPVNRSLIHGDKYVVYVRAWVNFNTYLVFQSSPITVDQTPPAVRKGRFVKDSDVNCNTDYDFIDWSNRISACWDDVFHEPQGMIIYYETGLGTAPGANDILYRRNMGLNTSMHTTGLDLSPAQRYYFSVTAYNNVGLHTTVSSDGFVVDIDKPISGVVYNTDTYRNYGMQSSNNSFSLSWQGFLDHDSGIHTYFVALLEDTVNQSVVRGFKNVSMQTSVTITDLRLKLGGKYIGAVKAVDAAGHESDVIYSLPKLVDTTPPTAYICRDRMLLYDEQYNTSSATTVEFSNMFETNVVYTIIGRVKQIVNQVRVKIMVARKIGKKIPLVRFHDGSSEFHFSFFSEFQGIHNVTLDIDSVASFSFDITLYKCNIMTVEDHGDVLTVQQLSNNLVKASIKAVDLESGIKLTLFGAGSSPSGFQLKSLHHIDSRTDHVFSIYASHGTPVYATAIVENYAGLRTVFHSKELLVDQTPPVIDNIVAEVEQIPVVTLSSKNNSMPVKEQTVYLKVLWNATDTQSGIQMCFVSVGSTPYSTDLQTPQLAIHGHQFVTEQLRVHHGDKLFVNVKCINKVEYATDKVSDPVIISTEAPSSSKAKLTFLPQSTARVLPLSSATTGNIELAVQSNRSYLAFNWKGFEDSAGINHYEYRLSSNNKHLTDWMNVEIQQFVSLQTLSLNNGQTYTAEVRAVNTGNRTSAAVTSTILIDSRGPQLTGYPANVNIKSRTITLNWKIVFTVNPMISTTFNVIVGSVEGFGDIVEIFSLKSYTYSFLVPKTSIITEDIGELFISVTAVYSTGMRSSYKTTYKIPA